MKIIFLDIDGVLNTGETFINARKIWQITGTWPISIDEHRIEYLKRIVDATDAKIVLSATVRKHFKKEDNKLIPIYKEEEELLKFI